jgi:hypothetical protein
MEERITLLIAGLGLLAVVFIPCSAVAEGHHQSGINGQTVLYTCPVVFPDSDCYRPYPTGFTVMTDNGRFVTNVVTDDQGRFEVFLKPGSYELIPDGAEDGFPLVKTLVVRVEKKQFTPVTIVYDSGIR